MNGCRRVYSSDKGGALWLIRYISGIRQRVSSFVVALIIIAPQTFPFHLSAWLLKLPDTRV